MALGSAFVSCQKGRRWQPDRTLIVLLLAATGWVALLVSRIDLWVEVYRFLQAGLARTSIGYVYHQLLATALAMIVLAVPASLIGSVLPLMIRLLSEGNSVLGARVGQLVSWNTLGAVLGVLLTGFVLMPKLGLRSAFLVLVLTLCSLPPQSPGVVACGFPSEPAASPLRRWRSL